MMILIHNICIGLRGEGKSHRVDIAINISAAIDVDNWNLRETFSNLGFLRVEKQSG